VCRLTGGRFPSGPRSDVTASELSGFLWHLGVVLPSGALERMAKGRLMLVVAVVVAPR
jgi:hypothetical protein